MHSTIVPTRTLGTYVSKGAEMYHYCVTNWNKPQYSPRNSRQLVLPLTQPNHSTLNSIILSGLYYIWLCKWAPDFIDVKWLEGFNHPSRHYQGQEQHSVVHEAEHQVRYFSEQYSWQISSLVSRFLSREADVLPLFFLIRQANKLAIAKEIFL